jgi:hypothetical protein
MLGHILIDRHEPGLGETATAWFSPCRSYRYALTRSWLLGLPTAVFVMLNPSTADAFDEDPTVRRCLGYARAWGCGRLTVLNLFALRSTYPKALYGHPDPVGPDNDGLIAEIVGEHLTDTPPGPVVAAWGAHGALHDRGRAVAGRLRGLGARLVCLGVTAKGQPKHPVRQRCDAEPVPFEPAAAPPGRSAGKGGYPLADLRVLPPQSVPPSGACGWGLR